MANPQPTPFVRFSKELFEAFYLNPPATVAGCRLWLWVLRWTWADFGKDETKERSLGQIAEEVGMSKASACRELQSLVRCRRLKKGDLGGYAIQKDYDLWRDDTKKRDTHFGNQMKQMKLEIEGSERSKRRNGSVSDGGTEAFHRASTDRSTVGHSTVPPYEPPIRSENTVENNKKARGARAVGTSSQLPNDKTDTPRRRAALGDPLMPPDEHPGFRQLPFNLRTELTDTWKALVDAARKKNECRKRCGRDRASEAWPYCRPCTVCHVCSEGADGTRKFKAVAGTIECSKCQKDEF